ncbi:hypothetical protein [Gelidibacter japonicus]|uniref:hypothetical protein n=1 Tax=Gelidibacter japonicus TaxID=1962232 RepID=UPI002B001002|nr:hypothetical protein [Gelidibacter japonicus]
MNFTITPQANGKLYLMLISSLLLIDFGIIMLFNFNWRESILLLIATPTLLKLFLKFVVPFMQKKAEVVSKSLKKEIMTEEQHKEHQIKIARKEGRRPFRVGLEKQHTVYARDFIEANKFFNKHIDYLAKKHPKKKYYYVTKKYNNL